MKTYIMYTYLIINKVFGLGFFLTIIFGIFNMIFDIYK